MHLKATIAFLSVAVFLPAQRTAEEEPQHPSKAALFATSWVRKTKGPAELEFSVQFSKGKVSIPLSRVVGNNLRSGKIRSYYISTGYIPKRFLREFANASSDFGMRDRLPTADKDNDPLCKIHPNDLKMMLSAFGLRVPWVREWDNAYAGNIIEPHGKTELAMHDDTLTFGSPDEGHIDFVTIVTDGSKNESSAKSQGQVLPWTKLSKGAVYTVYYHNWPDSCIRIAIDEEQLSAKPTRTPTPAPTPPPRPTPIPSPTSTRPPATFTPTATSAPTPNPTPSLASLTQWSDKQIATAFGISGLIVMVVLAIFFPHPTEFQYTVFRIVLALVGAGVGATIPGLVDVTISGVVRASGAIAVFVIVYFFSPAQLITRKPT
jgi:hypothetical protein